MPRACSICIHPKRRYIERAIARGGQQGSYRAVAERFGVSVKALHRHLANHTPGALQAAREAEEAASVEAGLDIRAEIRGLVTRARAVLEGEESQNDGRLSLLAIREIRSTLELLARLEGQLDTRAQVNILLHPDFVKVRLLLVESVGGCAECRARVAARLRELGAADV